jgi:cholestenol delta-isomerase
MGGDGHPYAPADLHLPGFVPQQLSQGQILARYLGTSVIVFLAVWLLSGNATTATCVCRGY